MALFDFTGGGLDGCTLSRAGTGTYYDAAGARQTAGADVARFDFDPYTHAYRGLLVERSATNLALYSDDISNAVYVARAATKYATGIRETSENDFHYVQQSIAVPATGQYVVSAIARIVGSPARLFSIGGSGGASFDIVAGAMGQTIAPTSFSSITRISEDEWRVAAFTTLAAGSNIGLGLSNSATPFPSYAGDPALGVEIRSVQVEASAGFGRSSEIPTSGATATRPVETLTLPFGARGAPDGEVPIAIQYDDLSRSYHTVTVAGGVWQMVGGLYARSRVRMIYTTVQPIALPGRQVTLVEPGPRSIAVTA